MTANVKRIWLVVVGALLCLTLATAADLGAFPRGQDDKQEKDKPDQGDKDKGKKQKDGKQKPRDVFCTIEMRDGSTIQCQFLAPKEIEFHTEDLGVVSVALDQLRFVECESLNHRASTFGLDLYVGRIETTEFRVRLLNTKTQLVVQRERVKRLVFPDPPQPVEPLFPEVKPETKDKKKDEKKDGKKDEKTPPDKEKRLSGLEGG